MTHPFVIRDDDYAHEKTGIVIIHASRGDNVAFSYITLGWQRDIIKISGGSRTLDTAIDVVTKGTQELRVDSFLQMELGAITLRILRRISGRSEFGRREVRGEYF